MSFEPTNNELLAHGDLFELIKEGRRIAYKENNTVTRIQEMREEASARSLAAAQKAMARLEWRPRASIALLNRCVCGSCGEAHTVFAGFGVEMYRQSDNALRTVMSSVLDPAYIRSIRYTSTVTQACMSCLGVHGFALEEEDHHGT